MFCLVNEWSAKTSYYFKLEEKGLTLLPIFQKPPLVLTNDTGFLNLHALALTTLSPFHVCLKNKGMVFAENYRPITKLTTTLKQNISEKYSAFKQELNRDYL